MHSPESPEGLRTVLPCAWALSLGLEPFVDTFLKCAAPQVLLEGFTYIHTHCMLMLKVGWVILEAECWCSLNLKFSSRSAREGLRHEFPVDLLFRLHLFLFLWYHHFGSQRQDYFSHHRLTLAWEDRSRVTVRTLATAPHCRLHSLWEHANCGFKRSVLQRSMGPGDWVWVFSVWMQTSTKAVICMFCECLCICKDEC